MDGYLAGRTGHLLNSNNGCWSWKLAGRGQQQDGHTGRDKEGVDLQWDMTWCHECHNYRCVWSRLEAYVTGTDSRSLG